MSLFKKTCLLFVLPVIILLLFKQGEFIVHGITSQELQQQIQQYENEIQRLQGQAKTLKNQIAQFDAQIRLTQLKISQTEERISLLGGRIDQLSVSLDSLSQAFSTRAAETYKMSRLGDPVIFLLSAPDLSQAVTRYQYLQRIQESDRELLVKLQDAQNTYETEKSSQEDLQKELEKERANLDSQKRAKADLLASTQGSESRYQSLLAQAKAQLAALSQYAQSVGISLIPHQDRSDDWGKYYNQRDENWGNFVINGQTSGCYNGACTIASVGCLITSYSMVVSHYGGSVSPSEVAANYSYFAAGTALFNNPGPSANGHSAYSLPRTNDQPVSLDELRTALRSNKSVIVGLSNNGGTYPSHYSDHWVVLRSVDGDSFKINDPLYAGAMNVSLKDHYSGWTIIQARVYN